MGWSLGCNTGHNPLKWSFLSCVLDFLIFENVQPIVQISPFINRTSSISCIIEVDLTSYIMMLKSAQFSSLKHVVDFARVIRASTDGKLRARCHTSVETNLGYIFNKIDEVLPYCSTVVSDIEGLLQLPTIFLLPFQRLTLHWKIFK